MQSDRNFFPISIEPFTGSSPYLGNFALLVSVGAREVGRSAECQQLS